MPQKGSRLDYALNIIDTPGFGDTRGIERDQQTVDQIRHLFSETGPKGVSEIDAVCFIVKAPDARLTASQRYIFHSILALFGKDIESNICTLITFADGAEPPVLASLQEAELPYGPTFQFNNSALFASNNKSASSSLSPMFWEMGFYSFKKFFNQLCLFKTKSLTLTKDVLQEREQLKAYITNVHRQVEIGLSKQIELEKEIDIFEKHKCEIENNKNFEYEVTETKQYKVQLLKGKHVTNCVPCNVTCHKICLLADDNAKIWCAVMKDGVCTICNCIWSSHQNARYILEYREEKVKKTWAEMKQKYEKATGLTMSNTRVIEELKHDVNDINTYVKKIMADMKRSKIRLNEIALRPDPLSTVEHIDLLILAENNDKKQGFQKRIEKLNEYRKHALVDEEVKKFSVNLQSANDKMKNHGLVDDSSSKMENKSYISKGIGKVLSLVNQLK